MTSGSSCPFGYAIHLYLLLPMGPQRSYLMRQIGLQYLAGLWARNWNSIRNICRGCEGVILPPIQTNNSGLPFLIQARTFWFHGEYTEARWKSQRWSRSSRADCVFRIEGRVAWANFVVAKWPDQVTKMLSFKGMEAYQDAAIFLICNLCNTLRLHPWLV